MNEGVTGIPRLVIVTRWNKTSEGRWSSMSDCELGRFYSLYRLQSVSKDKLYLNNSLFFYDYHKTRNNYLFVFIIFI